MIALVPLASIAPPAIDSLLDRAFGLDRRGRTAYRIRAGISALDELSFAALGKEGELLGTIQCWPVELACDNGKAFPLVMVGPVAVEPDRQQEGIGRALMDRMLDAVPGCSSRGCDSLMLVGDPEYYGRFFGFTAERTAEWRLPGPFESHRLLARGPRVPDCAGLLGPRSPRTA
ncbi:GNAT family N-acetyltransferase [Sphingomonas sp. M1-B02]|uniref:GNAT family N-acetyltransferase n=1 Tax=Sphingomonas sp. M1-B02 TaxID=3114300 RepID=UPI00223F808D|nr:N-acetyltransferase [Sphingomonas sp. S6-11]UZK66725.1 N-acetyltransferase [Sphingomonas sp. S6-11]